MDKAIVKAVIERSRGLCEFCGSNDRVQLHHIIGGRGKRRECETVHSVMALCWEHHHGDLGAHGKHGSNFNYILRKQLQDKYFSMGYTDDEVMRLMGGKLYT